MRSREIVETVWSDPGIHAKKPLVSQPVLRIKSLEIWGIGMTDNRAGDRICSSMWMGCEGLSFETLL